MTALQRFYLKTEIVLGPSMLDRLEAFTGQRVGVITDAFMVQSGVADRILAKLPGCETRLFGEAVPEPPLATISQGVRFFADFHPDAIVALGGGSSIDAAKAIVAGLRELDGERTIVMIAVPTTSGTGSEVTSYAVISEPERGIKHPLRSDQIVPDIALLDPDLVLTVPPKITADTGMDVITHAVEAYVAVGATDFSDAFAEKSLCLAFTHLPTVFADGSDRAARAAMHNASCMAGMAFNAAGLGLNHGMAHAIGGKLHIPHGRINAMLLPWVIEFNAGLFGPSANVRPEAGRYADLAHRIGLDAGSPRGGAKALARAVARLNDRLGIPATLRAHGADMSEYAKSTEELVGNVLADACTASNPRIPTPDDVAALLRAVGG